MRRLLLGVLGGVVVIASWHIHDARADVILVGPTEMYKTIDGGIAAARDGDTIVIDDGTYGPFVASKAVTLQAAHTGMAVIDGLGAKDCVIQFTASATIIGLTIQDAPNAAGAGTYQRDVGVHYTVKQCIFRNIGWAAIGVDNSAGTAGTVDATNCDILNCGRAVAINDGGTISISNSIIYNCPTAYELTYGVAISPTHDLLYNVAAIADGSNIELDPAQMITDPQFVDPANGNFHLLAGSPAIDTGINVGLPFFGSAPDRGAFEYVPEPSTLVLLGIGAISLLAYAWQRRKTA
jgi:hypothetical protein